MGFILIFPFYKRRNRKRKSVIFPKSHCLIFPVSNFKPILRVWCTKRPGLASVDPIRNTQPESDYEGISCLNGGHLTKWLSCTLQECWGHARPGRTSNNCRWTISREHDSAGSWIGSWARKMALRGQLARSEEVCILDNIIVHMLISQILVIVLCLYHRMSLVLGNTQWND